MPHFHIFKRNVQVIVKEKDILGQNLRGDKFVGGLLWSSWISSKFSDKKYEEKKPNHFGISISKVVGGIDVRVLPQLVGYSLSRELLLRLVDRPAVYRRSLAFLSVENSVEWLKKR